MAGAGYKLFNTGDVLTAAQVNTYLQEQVVMVFNDATARTTALSGVLAEGMMSYLKSDDTVYVYNGTSWVSVGSTGDITGVTAGTGLSGGGTSGDVTLSLSTPVSATNGGTAQTTYATGDLLYASASNTLAKRAIGTTGQVLTVSGGVPTWAAPAGGGKVLQVVAANYSTSTSNSTSTYADTGLTATITPTASTSKILVIVTQGGCTKSNLNSGSDMYLSLMRGGTEIGWMNLLYTNTALNQRSTASFSVLDNPATTSATTYKTRFHNSANVASVTVQNDGSQSGIVLMEIGA